MKKSAKIATLAIALFTGISGTAMANGTEVPPPPPPAPEPYTAPAPPPEVKPVSKSGPYISGDIGAAIWGKSGVKTGYVLNGAFGYNFMTLTPLVTKYVLHQGEGTLGWLTTTMAVGSICSGLYIAFRGRATRRLVMAPAAAAAHRLLH